jgi:hypothetical protein
MGWQARLAMPDNDGSMPGGRASSTACSSARRYGLRGVAPQPGSGCRVVIAGHKVREPGWRSKRISAAGLPGERSGARTGPQTARTEFERIGLVFRSAR